MLSVHLLTLTWITKLYGRVIELRPEDGHGKYMYMGQISVGHESVKYFLAGIELMKKSLAFSSSEQVMVLSWLQIIWI